MRIKKNITVTGLLFDLIPNSPNKHHKNRTKTEKRVAIEILGVTKYTLKKTSHA